jgi:hypothetical protein
MNKLGSAFDAFDIAWTKELIDSMFMTAYVGMSNIVIIHEDQVYLLYKGTLSLCWFVGAYS